MTSQLRYKSFLIRLWTEREPEAEWVAQVEHIPSGERELFTSLDGLFDFIRSQTGQRRSGDGSQKPNG